MENKRKRAADIEVIAPHFKRRLSGVTSTVKTLVPVQEKMGVKIITFGPGLPKDFPRFYWPDFFSLWKKPKDKPFRIWHARRNTEMLLGIFLRDICRMPLRVIFTSASRKEHDFYKKWLFRKMDYLISTSEKNSSYLDVPNTIVMHGVDCKRFHGQKTQEDSYASSKLPGKYAIGCFGRVRPSKGTDVFVDTMIELLPNYPDWTAILLGRTTLRYKGYKKHLLKKIKESNLEDRILFLNENLQMPVWYRRITLFVAASRIEGFGLTPLEAMASKTPVIAYDTGAFKHMITKDTGILLGRIDKKAMSEAVEPFLRNPEKAIALGKTARKFVKENFFIEKEAKGILDIYEMLWHNSTSRTITNE